MTDLHSKILDTSSPLPTRSNFLYFYTVFRQEVGAPFGVASTPLWKSLSKTIFWIPHLENEEGCCPYCFFGNLLFLEAVISTEKGWNFCKLCKLCTVFCFELFLEAAMISTEIGMQFKDTHSGASQSLSRGGQSLDRTDSPDFIWINIITDSCCMKHENKVKDLSHLFFLDETQHWINRLQIIG